MSLFSVILQEAARREREARTILGFLNEQMDGVDRGGRRWRSLKERIGFKVIGCCGATWGFRPTAISVRGEDDEDEDGGGAQRIEVTNTRQSPGESDLDPSCSSPFPASSPAHSGMNLATALAAERRLRASSPQGAEGVSVEPNNNDLESLAGRTGGNETPLRVSLMRLLEETEGGSRGEVAVAEKKREEVGNDSVCCVCMGRKKGAAFIPCGHTFCRVCSRELWLNRGSCPLCNRPILEILDIF